MRLLLAMLRMSQLSLPYQTGRPSRSFAELSILGRSRKRVGMAGQCRLSGFTPITRGPGADLKGTASCRFHSRYLAPLICATMIRDCVTSTEQTDFR
jgi:hypothetical protein